MGLNIVFDIFNVFLRFCKYPLLVQSYFFNTRLDDTTTLIFDTNFVNQTS